MQGEGAALAAIAELHETHAQELARDGGRDYGRLLRIGLAVGAEISASAYIRALKRRRDLARRKDAALADVDVLLLPAQQREAQAVPEVLGALPYEKPSFTLPFCVTGQPAMTICAGVNAQGLPVSLQLAARSGGEVALLRAARALEQDLALDRRHPNLDWAQPPQPAA